MPAAMTQDQQCAVCHERKPRNSFSVANGICMGCFDRSYGFCEECGITVYHVGQGITRSQHQRAYFYNGQTLCCRCSSQLGAHPDIDIDTWRPKPFDVACASYERIGSKRKFGVEIETSHCADYCSLNGRTKFGAKCDCTVSGMEFDSPILYGDEGLTYIEEFLAYGDDHSWSAGTECGCHTHYDMRDESRDQFLSIAYAYRKTQLLWEKFVPFYRRDASYSHRPGWNLSDFRHCVERSGRHEIGDWISRVDCERYEMVNFTAYHDHRTIEVRSLEGTVDPETICNWIAVNCRFIDGVRDMSYAEIDDLFGDDADSYFEGLSTLIGDDDLIDWLRGRAVRLNNHTFPE